MAIQPPVQYVLQASAVALPFRQALVQYVQPVAAVALPSSHTPVQSAQLAPAVYGQLRPITSPSTVQHNPANFSLWLRRGFQCRIQTQSQQEEMRRASRHQQCWSRVLQRQCHSGCSLDGTPDRIKCFMATCFVAASGSMAMFPTPGSSGQFDDRVSTGRHPNRHQPKDSYVREGSAEQARCLDIVMSH